MNKIYDFFQLFDQFISESRAGKRLKKDGTRIRYGTITQYAIVRDELQRFNLKENFPLRIRNAMRLNGREMKSEKVYWKRFQRENNYENINLA